MQDEILVLHLSDLHFGANSRFSELNLESLVKKFNNSINKALNDFRVKKNIDFVIITGDIVESGLTLEYRMANDFLARLSDKLSIDRKYFIFAPGNHDICWLDSQWAESEQKKDGFGDNELRERIDKYKLKEFRKFKKKFYGSTNEYAHELKRDSIIYNFSDFKLSIAAMNSCELESHRNEDHRGKLSSEQAQCVMNYWRDGEYKDWIKIVAIHHNPKPVSQIDFNTWKTLLESHLTPDSVQRYAADILGMEGEDFLENVAKQCQVQFILHGHQHISKEDSFPRKNGKGYIDILSAGSFGLATNKLPKDQKNSLRLILLDFKSKKLFSTIRIYDPSIAADGMVERGDFIEDPSNKIYEQDIFTSENISLSPIITKDNGEVNKIKSLEKIDYINIPVFLISMNEAEANKLFANNSIIDKWQLQLAEIYKKDRLEWKPPILLDGTSLKNFIESIEKNINKERALINRPLIKIRLYSNEIFDPNFSENIWSEYNKGAMFIIDSLSLLNNELTDNLLQTMEMECERNSILFLSPYNYSKLPGNHEIEQIIENKLKRLWKSFNNNVKTSCEIGIGDYRIFRKSVYSNLIKILHKIDTPLEDNIKNADKYYKNENIDYFWAGDGS